MRKVNKTVQGMKLKNNPVNSGFVGTNGWFQHNGYCRLLAVKERVSIMWGL